MGKEGLADLKKLLSGVLKELETPEKKIKSRLIREWQKIAGTKIAEHTKPVLLSKGELCVWVDQSALACELSQKHRGALLKRAQTNLGKETIKTIFFRVGQIR